LAKNLIYRQIVPVFLFAFGIVSAIPVSGQDLDFTDVAQSQIRQAITPTLAMIATQQESPLTLFKTAERPLMKVAVKIPSLVMPSGESAGAGFSSVWLAIGVSPNLVLGGHVAAAGWRHDDIQSTGVHFATSWGKPEQRNLFDVAVNHLYGPDDFHTRDVNLAIFRNYRAGQFDFVVAGSLHFVHCRIEINDHADASLNYQTTKNVSLYELRAGMVRNFGQAHAVGLDLSILRKAVSAGLSYQFTLN